MSQVIDPSTTLIPGFSAGNAFSAWKTERARALARHTAFGLPTHRDEEWKYTSVRGLAAVDWQFVSTANLTGENLAGPSLMADAIQLVFVNGRFAPELSSAASAIPGLTAISLATAVESHPDLVRQYLMQATLLEDQSFPVTAHLGRLGKPGADTFAALNTATFVDGAFIHVARNAKLDRPIHVRHLTAGDRPAAAPRLLVIVEEGADAQVLESYESVQDGPSFVTPVAEVFVGRNARLEHVRLQDENLLATHIGTTDVRAEADASYLHYQVVFGGHLTRHDLNGFLNGTNLHARMDGVIALSGDQLADNHTRLDHAFAHGDSFQVYKHVLAERSTAVFNGKIFVHQDAQKTDAKQTNQALLLSSEATMNTKPQLEIFADDVKCTHGATVGQLDDLPLFYLRTRGLPQVQARGLLVYAFAAEVLERISHPGLRDALEAKLLAKLNQV